MENRTKFGPKEQTQEQRLALIDLAIAINATQDRYSGPILQDLAPRYVAGELSLAECIDYINKCYPKNRR
jgi:hypothetical protein